ncbi:hypothetical protein IV454_01340 [Massilia antarctica]|uniref:SH3 domain-containing protein n=1 Tax=Massilia antarctica TaxID=2765360 RepID=A0AA49A8A3_9BURK|nr:hypothetical protein [Massilia antarctica]QPI50313.1 hypothetical protein IV454_01340 [Massilia antarctica]
MRTLAMWGIVLLAGTAQAASDSPKRWVSADDVRLRAFPGPDGKVRTILLRGTEMSLDGIAPVNGFCAASGVGTAGYVACEFLSAKPVARSLAGVDGVDAARRWVSGSALTLHAAPLPTSAAVTRLPLNTVVTLVREDGASGYCEVRSVAGAAGYTACRYLARTPVILANVQGQRLYDTDPLPADYDPERVFWLQPSWSALEQYADYLKKRYPTLPQQGPFPRNEALERMKAHLALGTHGRKPVPYASWSSLQRSALQYTVLSKETRRLRALGKIDAPALLTREQETGQIATDLGDSLGLWDDQHNASESAGASRIVALIGALAFIEVQPSLFRSDEQIAPPNATAEQASGRFGIVFRQLVNARPKPAQLAEDDYSPGLYDMLSRTDALVRSVVRVQLNRDGQLRAVPSVLRKTETLWRYADEPECAGWTPGFAFGDADAGPWRYFGSEAAATRKTGHNPPGSLYAFYTTVDLPPGAAAHREAAMTLDRAKTGFIRGTHLYYDIDADGIADLAVWEGEGKGPGHLEGPTSTDDRWYRLVLVNINGSWKLLGRDNFGYGCGC